MYVWPGDKVNVLLHNAVIWLPKWLYRAIVTRQTFCLSSITQLDSKDLH
jgi:hypothetical protein